MFFFVVVFGSKHPNGCEMVPHYVLLFLFKKSSPEDIKKIAFRDRKRRRQGGRKKNIDVKEKHWLFASCMPPDQVSYVPGPGIEPAT